MFKPFLPTTAKPATAPAQTVQKALPPLPRFSSFCVKVAAPESVANEIPTETVADDDLPRFLTEPAE